IILSLVALFAQLSFIFAQTQSPFYNPDVQIPPGNIPPQFPYGQIPYGDMPYGQMPYGNMPYTNDQIILQRRDYYREILGLKQIPFSPEESYFFLVGEFSLFLPYLLFSLPQPQISIFSLASIFLMYP
ncbi:MAG: hypothetical protein ACPLZH_01315, partial [Minisyncoccales bacterium]